MVRLVRADVNLLDAAVAGDAALARALGVEVVPGWLTFTEALRPARDAVAAEPARTDWGSRFFVTGDPPELVGWGGFKGPPEDGVVELGYEIAEARRGRGLATPIRSPSGTPRTACSRRPASSSTERRRRTAPSGASGSGASTRRPAGPSVLELIAAG